MRIMAGYVPLLFDLRVIVSDSIHRKGGTAGCVRP